MRVMLMSESMFLFSFVRRLINANRMPRVGKTMGKPRYCARLAKGISGKYVIKTMAKRMGLKRCVSGGSTKAMVAGIKTIRLMRKEVTANFEDFINL
jgi:hypothetical protein